MNVFKRLHNPILVNELRLRMRSGRAPVAITLYLAVLGGIVFTFIYLMTGDQTYFNPRASRELFMMLTMLQFALIGFVTPGLTAGVISGERERQTLDILLTTNSSASKIILGKWLSSLSFMMFLVLSSIPLYSIVFLYGGISPQQLVKVFLLYLITMFAVGSIGILFSTMFKRTGVATVFTYGFIFVYLAGTFIASVVIQELAYRSAQGYPPQNVFWAEFFQSINPLFLMLYVFDIGPLSDRMGPPGSFGGAGPQFALPVDPYVLYLMVLGGMCLICLLLAIYFIKPVRPSLRLKR
ncbi:ABC-type transport system involved in multi-copper enzyme maturation permease subunit [Caldalkalibacillus uzonensis]|uniref:ABC-type transport system involved in multi-copper enzyme maturation permease subunit n=1 Tax=Caldalkalibacillus uzonensis TaxID=353224 RepID=A0ABU0CNJ0_9BACI|nr:ABC transporter permease subunit [Caldalkalibacillus uzonensis]MDQ0337456.1 ABC-type transport system involved in multi-copper enzyme maturation permease subunit [Caldalkalibacillus uzonensis]